MFVSSFSELFRLHDYDKLVFKAAKVTFRMTKFSLFYFCFCVASEDSLRDLSARDRKINPSTAPTIAQW